MCALSSILSPHHRSGTLLYAAFNCTMHDQHECASTTIHSFMIHPSINLCDWTCIKNCMLLHTVMHK